MAKPKQVRFAAFKNIPSEVFRRDKEEYNEIYELAQRPGLPQKTLESLVRRTRRFGDEISDRPGIATKHTPYWVLDGKVLTLLGHLMLELFKGYGVGKASTAVCLLIEAAELNGNRHALRKVAHIVAFGKYGEAQDVERAVRLSYRALTQGNKKSAADIQMFKKIQGKTVRCFF